MNMARALDLYLALENAFDHYGESKYDGRLLSKTQKKNLEEMIKGNMDDLHTYEYKKIGAFFTQSNLKQEPGNRNLKIFVSMGYAAQTMQAYDIDTDTTQIYNSHIYNDSRTYLDEAFRAAGDQASSERIDYWSYQTDNGARFWAEGPYYMDYALLDVIPFWHAIRANGMLNYNNHNISDPFQSNWFMNPVDWLADLTTPDGDLPPLDDSNKYPIDAAPMLRWTTEYGGYDWSVTASKFAWIDDQVKANSPGSEDPSLNLVELAIPRIQSGSGEAPYTYRGNTTPGNKTEQQLVMRKDISGETHYLLLNGEDNDAVTRGEGHEQPDQLQLLYYVDGTSYLMDSGYDHSSSGFNSTWNGYNWHNTMQMGYYNISESTIPYDHLTYYNYGGIESPYVDISAEHKISHHNQVDTLYYENKGNITIMHGIVQLNTHGHDQEARYHRDVLFIDSPHPYVVDFNTAKTTKGSWNLYLMRYYGNGKSIKSNSNGWYDWENPVKPENGQKLFYYVKPVEFDETATQIDSTQEEYNGSVGTTMSIDMSSGANQGFTTVGVFEVSDQTPSYLPQKLIAYQSGNNTPYQVWSWHQDANTIDVIFKRSFLDDITQNRYVYIYDNSSYVAELKLPAGDDYGFIRMVKENGLWGVDTNYQVNLTRSDYVYTTSASIGTKTYPSNADIYIGDNTTLTVTGTMTLQSGTTVHLGKGAVISTSGSGNIQATGTMFKTLSGSNNASDRWLHIILNGNGGSTFTQCTFQGASQALYLNSTDNIDRCTFQYNSCGLYAWSGEAIITGSTFFNNYDYGIFMGGTGVAMINAYQSGSTFTGSHISESNYGVYVYDNAWAELKYTQVDNNNYGVMSYDYSILYAGNHNDSGGNASYVGQGWNRFSGSTNYAVYNGSSETAWADDNWWGSTSPPSSYFYGTVSHVNPLTYDPTINGAQSGGGSGGGCPPNCTFNTSAPSGLQAMNSGTATKETGNVTASSNNSDLQKNVSDRLSQIYSQLDNQPDAEGNYRLLQEAYGLTQLYDRADSSNMLTKLDTYSGQYKIAMTLSSNPVSGVGNLQSSQPAKSLTLSKAMRKLGATAVLLKMDYLLHESQWKQVQTLADRFAPYITNNGDKSAFLASRAVAWEHQKQFAKALAAYQQIDAMKPDAALPANYVAPDHSFIEATLKDSMQAYNQAPEAVASSSSNGQSESSLSESKKLPREFSLGDNYPNPFNPTTTIPINLPKASHVEVVVYNIAGQRVATLADREYQAGSYQLRFNAHELASGVYFIRARLGEKTLIKRMTLIK